MTKNASFRIIHDYSISCTFVIASWQSPDNPWIISYKLSSSRDNAERFQNVFGFAQNSSRKNPEPCFPFVFNYLFMCVTCTYQVPSTTNPVLVVTVLWQSFPLKTIRENKTTATNEFPWFKGKISFFARSWNLAKKQRSFWRQTLFWPPIYILWGNVKTQTEWCYNCSIK